MSKAKMTSERIKEIQDTTAYPNSISVKEALLQVWSECWNQSQSEIDELKAEVERLKGNSILCPKCNGQGIVSKPPHIAGDVQEWISNQTSYECNLCKGKMIINQQNT